MKSRCAALVVALTCASLSIAADKTQGGYDYFYASRRVRD